MKKKYENIFIVPRQLNEDDYAHIIRKQRLNNIFYGYKLLVVTAKKQYKQAIDFFRRDIRLLVWEEHCVLIKTIETLIEKQNRSLEYYF